MNYENLVQQWRYSPSFRLKWSYTIIVYALGVLMLVLSFRALDSVSWWLLAGVAVVYGLMDRFAPTVDMEQYDKPEPSEISIDITEAPGIFAVIVLGASGVVAISCATLVVMWSLPGRSKLLDVLDAIANRAISYSVVLVVYGWFPETAIPFMHHWGFLALFLLMVLYPTIQIVTFSLQRAVLSYTSFWRIAKAEFHDSFRLSILSTVIGVVAGIFWFLNPVLIVPVLIPLWLTHRALSDVVRKHVSDLKRERAEAENRFKTHFISMVSHDLRTPLNAIMNYAQLLGKPRYGSLTDKQQDLQSRLLNNARHLLVLVNDLLDKAKIEAGEIQCEVVAVDLGTLTQHCIHGVQGLAHEKGLSVHFTQREVYAWCDAKLMHQVMTNLLGNAIKFTHCGRITVAVTEHHAHVVVSVHDTGIGIAPEQADMVFKEFQQIVSPARVHAGGTGLGLAICKQLVEVQQGALWFESTVDVGSTFYVRLPTANMHAKSPESGTLIKEESS